MYLHVIRIFLLLSVMHMPGFHFTGLQASDKKWVNVQCTRLSLLTAEPSWNGCIVPEQQGLWL